MGTCGCGYTTDVNKNCNGTHRVVQAVKADIVKDLEANGFAEASAHVKGEKTEKQQFAKFVDVFLCLVSPIDDIRPLKIEEQSYMDFSEFP